MANQVTSLNDFTLFKAAQALMGDDKMTFKEASDAIERLRDAGLLIREPAEKEEQKKVFRGSPSESAEDKPAAS